MSRRAKVTDKGQITLPNEVRDRLNITPGDVVGFVEFGSRYPVFPKNLRAADLAGVLGKSPSGESLCIEEMDAAVSQAVALDYERVLREWSNTHR